MRREVWLSLAAAAAHNLGRLAAILLLAKLTSAETLGIYTYALAIVTPLVLVLGFEVRSAFVSDVRGHYSFRDYLRLRRIGLAGAAVVVIGLAGYEAAGGRLLPALILAGVGIGRIAWAVAEIGWGWLQRRERFDLIALGSLLRGAAQAVTFAGAVFLLVPRFAPSGPAAQSEYLVAVIWAAWSCALVWALIYWSFERRLLQGDSSALAPAPWRRVGQLALHTLPLALVQLMIALCDSVPRLWIAGWHADGLRQLGYFGALSYLSLAANIALVAVGTAASNRLAHHFHDDPRAFRRLLTRLVTLALATAGVVMVAAWLGGRWLLTALYQADYAERFPAFMLLMAAQCVTFLASMFGFAVTSMRLFWPQALIHATVLGATLAASAWFIPGGDPVYGAAWVAVLRSVVHTGLYAACLLFAQRMLARTARLAS